MVTPASSSSVTLTSTEPSAKETYSAAPEAAWVSVTGASSATSASCEAVTVTVCSIFQLLLVNVRLWDDSESSAPLGTTTVTVTLAVGSVSSTTV